MDYDSMMDGRREQVELEAEAEEARVRRGARTAFAKRAAWEAGQATIAAITGMFTSEPIPGVQSPFYAGERYYADAEDARRARLDTPAAPVARVSNAAPDLVRIIKRRLAARSPLRDAHLERRDGK